MLLILFPCKRNWNKSGFPGKNMNYVFEKLHLQIWVKSGFSKKKIVHFHFSILFSHLMPPQIRMNVNPDFGISRLKCADFFFFPGPKRASKSEIYSCRSNLFFKMYEVLWILFICKGNWNKSLLTTSPHM